MTLVYNIINCDMVQMMPGYNYVSGVDIYCDENGFMKPVNQLASILLGEYVFGGKLHGTICLTKEKILKESNCNTPVQRKADRFQLSTSFFFFAHNLK